MTVPHSPLPSPNLIEARSLCLDVAEMLRLTRSGFVGFKAPLLDQAEALGKRVHDREKEMTDRIVHGIAGAQFVLEADKQRLFVPLHLERAGDNIELFVRAVRNMLSEGVLFTDRAMREIEELIHGLIDLLENLADLLLTGNRVLRAHVIDAGGVLVSRADEFADEHLQRLIKGVCAPRASSLYLAMLDDLKGVEWHVREIAQKLDAPTAADVQDITQQLEQQRRDAAPGLGAVRERA